MSDLEFGLRITVAGMGIVFAVLLLLWGLLSLALRFERRGEATADAADGSSPEASGFGGHTLATAPAVGSGGMPVVHVEGAAALDPALVAAITVAVLHHAEARRLQAAPVMRSYWPGSLLFASRWVSAGRTRQGQSWRRSRR